MQITIAAIGRIRSGPERELVEANLKRARALGRQVGITGLEVREFPESGAATADLRRAEEARHLLGGLGGDAVVVTLDEHGSSLTSDAFARRLSRLASDGTGELAFLIGGPDGHGLDVLARTGLVMALGAMTWPHRLARVMLSEQIYRAVTILVNHPYHRA